MLQCVGLTAKLGYKVFWPCIPNIRMPAASVEFLALYSKQKSWTATVNNFSCQFRQELANSVANARRHHFNVPINQFQFSDRALADCCWPVAATSGAVGIWLRWCFPTLHETSYWNRRSKHWLLTCLRWTSPGLVSRLLKNQKYLYMFLHLNKRYWYFDTFFSEGQDSSAVKWDRPITLITHCVVLN